ncbi:unnamed protein product [Closterium sp. NIES-54]
MASPSVLTFDAEGRAVDFDVWLDDLQLFLQCDSKDGLSLFDLTSGASTAPVADIDSAVRSQWLTRDAAARLAMRSHLPSTERAHFSQYKSAKTLYEAVVARYSSPATAALSRLMLPYLFPDLAAFATVTDLITHLRTSDTHYRAALPAKFCTKNPPPMYITLYYLVTRLPDTLRSVRDHFLSLCPTTLTVDLLEEHLLASETSITAVGASRGDPRTTFFEGRSALRLLLVRGAATARASGARALEEVAGEEVVAVYAEVGVGVGGGGRGGGVGGSSGGGGSGGGGGWGGGGGGGRGGAGRGGAVQRGPQHQSRSRETPSPRQLQQCGGLHATQRCFGRLTDAWRSQFPDATGIPRWGDLLKSGVAIFDLDFDAILAAMYAVSISAKGDCYVCVPPDPGIEAAALGASESAAPGARESAAPGSSASTLSGTASAQVLHTFTLDSGASRSFFRDRTTLTPLSRPVAVSLADPSGGPVLARYSIVLPCPAAPSGSLSGLYLPSFSTNLVSGADLQDGGVAASSQVFAAASRSGSESSPCSCRLLSHQTLLWHHRLGHPSLPRLRGMASCVLVSGLPRSLPPLPPGPAPTCVPCIEGRQRAAPHSSEFPPTEAPLQTLHMDVWGPARVRGQGRECYFLLVVDDFLRYTSVFPLRRKDEVTEFSSDLLRDFCRAEGIRQTFMLPASPQKNGIAERRIGMVMDVARTSMIHVAAPHFLWPFATSPTLRWTGKVGDASAFHVWGSRAFIRDLYADKLSSRAVPCVFLGFPPGAPGWEFYHPTSRRVLSSQDVTFDESVPYYRLFPYRAAPLPPPPLFLTPVPPLVDPLPPQGPAPSGVSQVDAVEPVEVAVDSGTSGGAEPECAGSGGVDPESAEPGGAGSGGDETERAEPWGAGSGGAELERAEPLGAGSGGAESGVAERGGAEPAGAGPGGPSGALSRQELPSPQELREWFARRWSRAARAGGAAGAGGSTAAGGAGATGPGGARTGGTGAAECGGAAGAGAAGGTGAGGTPGAGAPLGTGVGATGAAGGAPGAGGGAGVGVDAGGAGAVPAGSGGAARPRPYFVPLLEQVLGLPPSPAPAPSLECSLPVRSESQLQLASPLPAPSPYAGPTGGLAERHEPESRPASPVRPARTSRRVPPSSLPARPDPESDYLRAASPTVTRFLATVVTNLSFEFTAASALVAELVDFAAHCRLDYAASLVAESESVCPPSVGGECALSTDVLED